MTLFQNRNRLILGKKPISWFEVGIYVLFWLILIVFPLLMATSGLQAVLPLGIAYVHLIPFMIVFAANHFYLVPKILLLGHWRRYLRLILIATVLMILMKGVIHGIYVHYNPSYHLPVPLFVILIGNILGAFLIIGFDTAVRVSSQWLRDAGHHEQVERENLESKIAVLRHQISPHFFMNTLNNIHALVDIDPDRAKESCIRLSRMMRYLLYDSESGLTSLAKEVEFISSFFDLMRLRFHDQVELEFESPTPIPSISIPSFLFIPFLENAFKHGVHPRGKSYVRAKLSVHNGSIHFSCVNSRHPSNAPSLEKSSGLGLSNLRNRLSLLYPDQHKFEILEDATTFSIILEIPCP